MKRPTSLREWKESNEGRLGELVKGGTPQEDPVAMDG